MNVALRDNQNPQVPSDLDDGYSYGYGYDNGYGYDASGQPTTAYAYQQVLMGYDAAGQPVYAAVASSGQPAGYQPGYQAAGYQPAGYQFAADGAYQPTVAYPAYTAQPAQSTQPVQPVVYPYAAQQHAARQHASYGGSGSYPGAGGYGGPSGPGGGYPGYPGGMPPEPPKKGGKAGLIAAIVLLVVGLALLVGALVTWINAQNEYQVGIDEYTEVAQTNVTEDVATGRPVVDFAALKQQNADIVGWIQIPGTSVNYPVCQHGDNDYYLEHTFLGQYNLAGAIFMDYRSSSTLQDWNTVIYGHHLKNGEMFARVADYSNQAEFDTLKNIYYVSDDGQVHVLVPLCCMVVNGYDVASIQFDFADQASFEYYVQSLIDRSSARSATATAAGVEHIYMFSTCSYAQENDRTILVCVDLNGFNGPVVDATQSMNDIQAAADAAAGIADTQNPVEG